MRGKGRDIERILVEALRVRAAVDRLDALDLLLLLVVGFLLAVRVGCSSPLELAAWTLLGALAAVPVTVVGIAWLVPTFVTPVLVIGVAAVWIAGLLATGSARAVREQPWRAPTGTEWLVAGIAAAVGLVAAALHTDLELMLSLASWLRTGEAECFYMQTFALVGELNAGAGTDGIRDAWGIVNSPGNTVYTAPLMATLDDATFRVVDVLFRVLLFLFLQLAVHRWTGRLDVSLLAALFALLNPFVLSVEVLDRNIILSALAAALVLALRAHPDKALLHGLLLGLVAVSGLRFLPLVFAATVAMVHLPRGTDRRGWAAIGGGFLLPFLVAVPHLQVHGLHSMGETESLWALGRMTLTELPRTPFLPFPTGAWYMLTTLDALGLLACGLGLLGAFRSFRREPAWAVGLVVPILGITAVLTVQRDWIQGDKIRIGLEALVPAVLLAALGLAELFDRYRWRVAVAELGVAVAVLAVSGFAAGRIVVPPDPGTYVRHPVHQTETEERLAPARAQLRRFGLLPDYGRLGFKLDVGRKRAEEAAVRATLFGPGGALTEVPRSAGWWGGTDAPEPPRVPLPADSWTVAIDLARLPSDPRGAVRVDDLAGPMFVDLTSDAALLDVYFREVDVAWQPQPLGVAALPLRAEVPALGELYLDLNAFKGFGTDALGLVQVGSVAAAAGTLAALPDDGGTTVVVRIPRGWTIVVRDWLVDVVAGTPHRVDSWIVRVGDDGAASVEFLFAEPESYL